MNKLSWTYLYTKLFLSHLFNLIELFCFGEPLAKGRSELYYNIGNYYLLEKRETEKATKYFNKSIELNPNFSYPYAGLASVFFIKQSLDKAMDFINKAINLLSDYNQWFYSVQYMISRSLEDEELMEKSFDELCKYFNGSRAEANRYLAYSFSRFEMHKEVELFCKEAIKECPDEKVLHYNLGAFYFTQKKYVESIAAFQPVLQSQEDEKNKKLIKQAKGYISDCKYYISKNKK